jgi:HK97 gp10 family phage protein
VSDARVEWYGDEVVAQVEGGMKDALSVGGAYMVGAVRAEITNQDLIDTGNLRASIDHEAAGPDREKIGTNVHYAIYLEYGTSRMGAKAFMRRSMEDGANKANVRKLAMAALRGAI